MNFLEHCLYYVPYLVIVPSLPCVFFLFIIRARTSLSVLQLLYNNSLFFLPDIFSNQIHFALATRSSNIQIFVRVIVIDIVRRVRVVKDGSCFRSRICLGMQLLTFRRKPNNQFHGPLVNTGSKRTYLRARKAMARPRGLVAVLR